MIVTPLGCLLSRIANGATTASGDSIYNSASAVLGHVRTPIANTVPPDTGLAI
jgi:hypothetical protein